MYNAEVNLGQNISKDLRGFNDAVLRRGGYMGLSELGLTQWFTGCWLQWFVRWLLDNDEHVERSEIPCDMRSCFAG